MRRAGLLRGIADLLALWIAVCLAYYVRFQSGLIALKEFQPFSFYLESALLVSPFYLFLMYTMGNYQERHGRITQYEIQNLSRSIAFFYVLCIVGTFLFHSQEHSRITIGLSFFFNALLCLLFRKFFSAWQSHRWSKGIDVERLLVIGKDNELLTRFAHEISNYPKEGYRIVCSRLYQHRDAIETEEFDRVILVGDFTFSEIADVLIEITEKVRVDFIPTYYAFLRTLPFREQVGSFPVLPLNRKILSDWSSVTKRIMDIAISSIILILTSPLILVIALVIRFSYGKPVLYRQERVGQNGSPFELYKFRTMKQDSDKEISPVIASEKQTLFKLKDDPRVENTFARFLRRTGLDELPQLWNVFEGTMSLVGPRPATTELVRNYSPQHKLRLAIPPGITGLQQVSCRGSNSMDEVLKYDLQYISEQSLWLDLYILTRTVSTLLLGKGTP